ncbi:N-acetylmuramoyl-L-alanine amidase [Flagellimonas sp. CMM7]|uniref:N-acetylmuramoyl-L-alanine amidase family protein n=1 Tax=Flagellimonas sp. CMM7 TaxID=2654676 RepID=UPI0013D117F2|nr:N-acetylmuramoyl-L-alanine amidase [Flagellimonas sp. CMM7]UII81102.1 N-acetylmuramoyl-L-alanine amidase [Flagellimonas sp. CMM7]
MEQTKAIFLLCLFSVFITVYGQKKQIIIVDPGHGGTDNGAVGINGLREKDLTLKIAQAIVHYNRILLDKRYDIYLTRYGDTLISLGHRTKLAKILDPKIFVSLHCNHANNPKASGLEVYVFNGSIPKQSLTMAKVMDGYLQEQLGYRSRGVKRANFQVLRDNREVCPALLLELGFLSNTDEAVHLEEKGKIKALGLAILMGIKTIME